MADKTPLPAGLGVRGRRFWRETASKYELSGPETELLTEVCRTLDDLDVLAAAVTAAGATVVGSQGQPVVNPALTEARGQRQALHRLLAALALPDDEDVALPSVQRLRASRAASARWQGHRGDVAKRAALGVKG